MEPRQPAPSFLDALQRKEMQVQGARGSIRVRELGLGAALRYQRLRAALARKDPADDSPPARAAAIWQLLEFGLEGQVVEMEDLPAALAAILEVNEERPLLAFQRLPPNAKPLPPAPSDYEGREGAWIVAQLAGAFGWSAEQCLEGLTYYQAMCFLQEALLLEHNKQRFAYALSEVGIRKSGDSYVKDPFPDLPWMSGANVAEQKPSRPLPPKFAPDGVVVDFSTFADTGKATQYEIPRTAEEAGSETDGTAGGVGDGSTISETP